MKNFELLHCMHEGNGRKGFMALKLAMSKATAEYDLLLHMTGPWRDAASILQP